MSGRGRVCLIGYSNTTGIRYLFWTFVVYLMRWTLIAPEACRCHILQKDREGRGEKEASRSGHPSFWVLTTDRRHCVVLIGISFMNVWKVPEFAEITQNTGHYAVQNHSRSPILVPIESSYNFLLVINTNLPPILHRFRNFRDIAVDRSEIAILGYPSCLTLTVWRTSPGTISVKCSVDVNGWPRYLKP